MSGSGDFFRGLFTGAERAIQPSFAAAQRISAQRGAASERERLARARETRGVEREDELLDRREDREDVAIGRSQAAQQRKRRIAKLGGDEVFSRLSSGVQRLVEVGNTGSWTPAQRYAFAGEVVRARKALQKEKRSLAAAPASARAYADKMRRRGINAAEYSLGLQGEGASRDEAERAAAKRYGVSPRDINYTGYKSAVQRKTGGRDPVVQRIIGTVLKKSSDRLGHVTEQEFLQAFMAYQDAYPDRQIKESDVITAFGIDSIMGRD